MHETTLDCICFSEKYSSHYSAAFLHSGLIGPAVPLSYSYDSVILAAGFDSDFFNFFPWSTDSDQNDEAADAVPQINYSPPGTEAALTERYNRLTFGVRDPVGRIVTGTSIFTATTLHA